MLNTGCMKHDGANLGSSHHTPLFTVRAVSQILTLQEKNWRNIIEKNKKVKTRS